MTKIVLSILVWTIGVLLTVAVFFAMLAVVLTLFPFDRKRKLAHSQCYWWAAALTAMNPYWKCRVSGLENIDRRKAYVIVVNHQSLADIIVLYRTRMQFKWIAKDSLFKVPFVGWCLSLAKHIRISRGKFSSIKKVYRESARWLRDGISVLFFPEGTRSKNDEMSGFFNGAFKLAIIEKKPILPIVLDGTGDAIPKGSWVFKSRVECNVKVLPAIDTSSFLKDDFEKLKDLTRLRMKAAISPAL